MASPHISVNTSACGLQGDHPQGFTWPSRDVITKTFPREKWQIHTAPYRPAEPDITCRNRSVLRQFQAILALVRGHEGDAKIQRGAAATRKLGPLE